MPVCCNTLSAFLIFDSALSSNILTKVELCANLILIYSPVQIRLLITIAKHMMRKVNLQEGLLEALSTMPMTDANVMPMEQAAENRQRQFPSTSKVVPSR